MKTKPGTVHMVTINAKVVVVAVTYPTQSFQLLETSNINDFVGVCVIKRFVYKFLKMHKI